PLAVLLRSYALEDRLSRAALEVQATETVVSGQDRGAVATYLDRINRNDDVVTTVLYPPSNLHPEGEGIGPSPGENKDVAQARLTGQASVQDDDGGAEILVPVSLGGNSTAPADTPVIRVEVRALDLEPDLVRSWSVLVLLGIVLLGGALLLADRLGRSFVVPIGRLAAYAGALGRRPHPEPVKPSGPREVQELTRVMNRLVGRIEGLLERERAGVADMSHRLQTPMTALRSRIDALADNADRARLSADLDELQATVDLVVQEARRSEREGLAPEVDAVAVVAERVRYWAPLAEEKGRPFEVHVDAVGSVPTRTTAEDLQTLVDVLLDNVFTHTEDDAAVQVTLSAREGGGLVLTVDDSGPGLPTGLDVTGRGASGSGSAGLGLAIAEKTATESGGALSLNVSPSGGTRVVVELGGPT
ncbi:MAG TPA: HAMP domain-containing sensor histidine kinase, partial [Nocardioides sp.]|nr:HAMP domain-containing sensor histidine kinase [Nocardioides sp.]